MKEKLKERLKELTSLVGVSGSEQEVVKYMKNNLEKYADEVMVDPFGNVIATKHGKNAGPKLMIAAHSDEIGFSVKNILSDGFILFNKIGMASDKVLEGRKVLIKGSIPGVIGIKPGHLQTPEETKKVNSSKECYIDVGASSKEEVESLGIGIGDPIGYRSDFMEMANSDYICTKSIDNRMNCAILIELFSQIKDLEFDGTIYGVVTVQEETGMKGAFMVGNRIEPDYAIVIDTIPSGDTPDVNTERDLPIYLGKGPACVIADGILPGLLFTYSHPSVIEIIREQAKLVDVNVQYTTLVGEGYATDAARLSYSGKGIPTAMLVVPRRYSHSPVELVNINDALGSLSILENVVKQNGKKEIKFV
ncbi:endoglucanase [Proteiniborus ethanoligenes]|uniref:Endoglucanase n=1 Tax=Proteiniborus ethanoligenes TaxID=415015 RepID=A0A1H3SEL2_9FIRM|nr:M20/M25/M40 family metallo-hydrolase [Proteiniborus ethanoligenes]SDZ36513.1 endoglucanase [Proteiniborus ethanoligenes]